MVIVVTSLATSLYSLISSVQSQDVALPPPPLWLDGAPLVGKKLTEIDLLLHLACHMIKAGYNSAGLGVVVGNDPAVAFYERMGGRRAGGYTDPGPVWRSDNHLYVWDDLPALVAHGVKNGP